MESGRLASGVQTHVYQRICSALAVMRRSPHSRESYSLVETEGLFILFIHICCKDRMEISPMLDQAPTDAFASLIGRDEQGIYVTVRQTHKSDSCARPIDGKPERD